MSDCIMSRAQVQSVFDTLLEYSKEYDTETGAYKPESIFSVYVGDSSFLFYAWLPEVCCVMLYTVQDDEVEHYINDCVMTTAAWFD